MSSPKDNDGALNGEEPPTSLPPSTRASPFFGNNVTTLLFAVISLAIYLLLLRPTTAATREERQQRQRRQQQEQRQRQGGRRMTSNNNNNNVNVNANTRPANRPGAVAAPGGGGAGGGAGIMGTTPRQPPLSENAIEILADCRSGPPHLQAEQLRKIKSISMSTSDGGDDGGDKNCATTTPVYATAQQVARTIGGNQFLVDGVVGWSYTSSASAAKQISAENAKQLRQDRAKILTRWLTKATDNNSNSGGGNNNDVDDSIRTSNSNSISSNLSVLPPPAPKSTVVIGLSFDMIVGSSDDTSSPASTASAVVDILYRLSTYYSVLLMVQVPGGNSSNSDNSNKSCDQSIQQIINILRATNNGLLTEQILPSHRIMACQSTTGRVSLVRQLRQVGLVIDFDPTVRTELERFGYSVSIVAPTEWTLTASSLAPLSSS